MIILICFRVISVCQPANRPATKYWRLSINWCQETYMICPPRKATWKVAHWAPHRRRAASRGGGGFDLVIACREEWEMSPGGDERTDLRQVGESTASLFCSGPTTAYEPPEPTWGLDRSRGVISPPRRRERVLQTDRYVSPMERHFAVKQNYITENKCSGVGKKKRVQH